MQQTSATIIIPDFGKKSGIFLTFYVNSHWLQICFGDSLGIAQNHGWEKPNFFIENGFSVNSAIFSPQTPPPGHPQLLLWQWQSGVRKLLPLLWHWHGPIRRQSLQGPHHLQLSWKLPYSEQSQQKDSHRLDTTASLTGTSLCTYAIEPPCTERYARWCERSGLCSPSYSILRLI